MYGNECAIYLMLSRGVPINQGDDRGLTAFHLAMQVFDLFFVFFLIYFLFFDLFFVLFFFFFHFAQQYSYIGREGSFSKRFDECRV